jgi:hypothetical protein
LDRRILGTVDTDKIITEFAVLGVKPGAATVAASKTF